MGIHGSMLLSEYREVVQIWVSPNGQCEYYFLSEFGRIAHMCLAISGRQLSERSPTKEVPIVEALKPLAALGGLKPPASYRQIQAEWGPLKPGDWPVWDGQLAKTRGQTWNEVIRPLARHFKAVFPDWRLDRHQIDARWTRKIPRKLLADYIFR